MTDGGRRKGSSAVVARIWTFCVGASERDRNYGNGEACNYEISACNRLRMYWINIAHGRPDVVSL